MFYSLEIDRLDEFFVLIFCVDFPEKKCDFSFSRIKFSRENAVYRIALKPWEKEFEFFEIDFGKCSIITDNKMTVCKRIVEKIRVVVLFLFADDCVLITIE